MQDLYTETLERKISELEEHITNAFHEIYYWSQHTWNYSQTTWLGIPIFQCPLDLWVLQEILVATKPDYVIELGSGYGGTALFMVSCFPGKVISIDRQEDMKPIPVHPRIEFVRGGSQDISVINYVERKVAGKRALLYQDGDHTADGVYKDLCTYERFVPIGSYIIVHDTNLGGRPITIHELNGNLNADPHGGVVRFLHEHKDFVMDRTREKYYLTFSPGGWLKRIEPEEKPEEEKPASASDPDVPTDYTDEVRAAIGAPDYRPGGPPPVVG